MKIHLLRVAERIARRRALPAIKWVYLEGREIDSRLVGGLSRG